MKLNFKNQWFLRAGAVALALLTANCAEYKIRKLETTQKEGLAFSQSLAKEYEALAKKEANVYNDQIDAEHFAVKGLQASTGLNVLPEDPNHWDLPDGALPAIQDGRERLIFALDKSGRRIAPDLAAQTQVSFDCWVEEVEENWQPENIEKCHKMFMDNLLKLEKTVHHEAPTFMVFFNFNSSKLTKDAEDLIKEAARVSQHLDRHTVTISGHTDGVGGRKHNLILSQNRAEAVKNMLVHEGVPAERIIAVGEGEVPGGAEVYPRNRMVVIHIH